MRMPRVLPMLSSISFGTYYYRAEIYASTLNQGGFSLISTRALLIPKLQQSGLYCRKSVPAVGFR